MYIPTALTDACCRDGLHISEMLSYHAICARFGDVVNLLEILCTFHNIVHAMTLLFGGGGNGEGGVAGLWEKDGV